MIEVGTGIRDITPEIGGHLDGFAARPGPSTGILDRLSVRALVFREGSSCFALLSFDVVGLPAQLCVLIKGEIASRCGIPGDAVMLAATHTHSGPAVGLLEDMPFDPGYLESLPAAAAAAVLTALSTCGPAEFAASADEIAFPVNRRDILGPPAGGANEPPVDRTVRILSITGSGALRALVAHASCHPVSLSSSNTLVSADFPAGLYEMTAAEFPGVLPVYLTGGAGDVNPAPMDGESPREVRDRCADELAGAVRRALSRRRTGGISLSGFRRRTAEEDVPIVYPYSAAETRSILHDLERQNDVGDGLFDLRLHARSAIWYRRALDLVERDEMPASVRVELQVLCIGKDLLFIALPFEVFTSTVSDLVSIGRSTGCPEAGIFVIGMANGAWSYLPPRDELARGGYEAGDAAIWYGLPGWYSPDAESRVRERLTAMIGSLG